MDPGPPVRGRSKAGQLKPIGDFEKLGRNKKTHKSFFSLILLALLGPMRRKERKKEVGTP